MQVIYPRYKTDVNDAMWLADLLAHGLIRASFVPPTAVQELRTLTRTRKQFVRDKIVRIANKNTRGSTPALSLPPLSRKTAAMAESTPSPAPAPVPAPPPPSTQPRREWNERDVPAPGNVHNDDEPRKPA